jgi:hypothetical protein
VLSAAGGVGEPPESCRAKDGGRCMPRTAQADARAVPWCQASARFGSFQPGRGKWHVYPFGYFCR